MFVLVMMGGRGGDEYEVREMDESEVRGWDVCKSWEEVSDGVWCEENDVVVLGVSEEECVRKLREMDGSDGSEYVKCEESWRIKWVSELSMDEE